MKMSTQPKQVQNAQRLSANTAEITPAAYADGRSQQSEAWRTTGFRVKSPCPQSSRDQKRPSNPKRELVETPFGKMDADNYATDLSLAGQAAMLGLCGVSEVSIHFENGSPAFLSFGEPPMFNGFSYCSRWGFPKAEKHLKMVIAGKCSTELIEMLCAYSLTLHGTMEILSSEKSIFGTEAYTSRMDYCGNWLFGVYHAIMERVGLSAVSDFASTFFEFNDRFEQAARELVTSDPSLTSTLLRAIYSSTGSCLLGERIETLNPLEKCGGTPVTPAYLRRLIADYFNDMLPYISPLDLLDEIAEEMGIPNSPRYSA